MTTTQTAPAESRGQAWRARRRHRAYGVAPEASPGRSASSPAPGRSSSIAPPEGCPGPAGREDGGLAVDEETDAGTFAYQLTQHLEDAMGDEHADAYLAEVVGELMLLCPAVRERFSDELLGELKEEIARREDPRYAHATITMIEGIETDWRIGR